MMPSFLLMHTPHIPVDYTPPPLGTQTEIVQVLKSHFPAVDASNLERIKIGSEDSYDDFSLGDKEIVTLLTVRNPSEALLNLVVQHTDWKILGAESGKVVHCGERAEADQEDEGSNSPFKRATS